MSRPLFTLVVLSAAVLSGCGDPCRESGEMCSIVGTGEAGNNDHEDRADRTTLYGPMDVVVWNAPDEFFLVDWNNHRIRLVQDGILSTIVGTEFLGDGDPDFQERVAPGVPGTTVALNHPTQAEWNPVTGKLLLPSWHNHRVREWTPETGNSFVVCANTAIDDGNGANAGFAGDGGPAADALMSFPSSITIDPVDGSFWLLAQKNGRIRKVAADYSLIDTVAGTGETGYSGDGGPALEATFDFWDPTDLQPEPSGAIEFDGEHTLYIADSANHVIRVFDTESGLIDTLPGTGDQTMPGGVCDPGALCFPRDVEYADGMLYIADTNNSVVRAYDLENGTMETVAGNFEQGDAEDGIQATEGSLDRPWGVDIAQDGTLLIADTYNHRIRKVLP